MRVFIEKGAHETLESGACVMEFAAWVAGEPHSDHPHCVSPVIGQFCRTWNDALNDADRQMLVPVALAAVGTNTGRADDEVRAWMCVDWLARVHAPAWLRLAKLDEHARALEGLVRIMDASTAELAKPMLAAARDAAWYITGAWDGWAAAGAAAAGDAAGAVAAGDAAWYITGAWDGGAAAGAAAAGDAAGAAARDAAGTAARHVAGNAAQAAAARVALRPTVEILQRSALELVLAMCEVGRQPEPTIIEERAAALRQLA